MLTYVYCESVGMLLVGLQTGKRFISRITEQAYGRSVPGTHVV